MWRGSSSHTSSGWWLRRLREWTRRLHHRATSPRADVEAQGGGDVLNQKATPCGADASVSFASCLSDESPQRQERVSALGPRPSPSPSPGPYLSPRLVVLVDTSVLEETEENKKSLKIVMFDSQESSRVNRSQGLEKKKKEHSRI